MLFMPEDMSPCFWDKGRHLRGTAAFSHQRNISVLYKIYVSLAKVPWLAKIKTGTVNR